MSAFGALDRGTRIAILLLGAAVAAGIGYFGWQMTRPAPAVEAAAQPDPAKAPDPAPASETPAAETPAAETAAVESAPAPQPPAEPAPVLPQIDTWRVAADGEAVVSGSAKPGATVEVVVDDVPVASGAATASGEFAILFTLAPNPKPSLMWISMKADGLPPVASEEMVALGPIEGPPPAVAEAAPEDTQIATAEDPAPPAALLLSEDGAVVLQDPSPDAAATPATDPAAATTASVDEPKPGPTAAVMIDTISYTPAGEVQVGGRGQGGAALRLYLDNAEQMTLQVPATGRWVTTLPDTAPGIYTLRVDQLDADGKVISRFETPFKRETLEALAAATEAAAPEPAPQELAAVTEAPPQTPAAPAETAPEPAPDGGAAAPEPAPDATAAPAAPEAPAAPQTDLVATPPAPVTVTVQPGFTLWGIAQDRMGDGVMYVQVFEANKDKIKDPDLIYPGQVFTMPETAASP